MTHCVYFVVVFYYCFLSLRQNKCEVIIQMKDMLGHFSTKLCFGCTQHKIEIQPFGNLNTYWYLLTFWNNITTILVSSMILVQKTFLYLSHFWYPAHFCELWNLLSIYIDVSIKIIKVILFSTYRLKVSTTNLLPSKI